MAMHKSARHGGGLAAWSTRHPIGVSMIALALIVLGLFALGRLAVDLLPHIIYPEIRVRIIDPGVPAKIMEDQITRQLEEQLAITEDAIAVQSQTSEGQSSVDLSFSYGKDIDIALRDASTRLDRAKRFLPDTINPPVIYKRDPAQIPVAEMVITSSSIDSRALRDWVDYDFSKQFLNLPGVAAVEVGGGRIREIQVLPDPLRLAGVGLGIDDLITVLEKGNIELPAGRLTMTQRELSGRTAARFDSIESIARLPLTLANGDVIPLSEVAAVVDTHADERIMVRLNGIPGVKISIQKQPTANTINVVDAVNQKIDWLKSEGMLPQDVELWRVADQSVYVRNALNNASLAALSGTLLAMAVVYLFLGNLRRTLIIGSAIPIAIMVTFILMGGADLTFNIMTLGGLALGVGMLVDNTIIMLENIQRHQKAGESNLEAGENAAREINSAILASTSTNLAAVLPFLFISGLVGLLFRELIFTISAAIVASMVIALTLVPALGVRVTTQSTGRLRHGVDSLIVFLQERYAKFVGFLLHRPLLQLLTVSVLIGALAAAWPMFSEGEQIFLPPMDDGEVSLSLYADNGTSLSDMNASVQAVEELLQQQPEVVSVFSVVGGSIFGRSEREVANRSYLRIQLVPRHQRGLGSDDWIARMNQQFNAMALPGIKIRMRTRGIRGIRTSSGDDALSVRIQGPDLETLKQLGDEAVKRLRGIEGLRNLQHSAEESSQELALTIDRQRVAELGLSADTIGRALRLALDGQVATDFIDGDRAYDIRVRLPRHEVASPQALEQIILPGLDGQANLRLGDVAHLQLVSNPSEIRRDNQRRIVEVSGSFSEDLPIAKVMAKIDSQINELRLPPGYVVYNAGEYKTLQQGRELGNLILALALFLVFVVMAILYESLRNPFIIMLSVPFAAIGVALGLIIADLPLSMPVWLGMIMLAGIVVNNAIVLVEYIEISRHNGYGVDAAIVEAARLRLRPILMTTLTTVIGMLPLAIGAGEGAEMLQPLAVSIIGGLSLSLLVTLVLIPIVYRLFHRESL